MCLLPTALLLQNEKKIMPKSSFYTVKHRRIRRRSGVVAPNITLSDITHFKHEKCFCIKTENFKNNLSKLYF